MMSNRLIWNFINLNLESPLQTKWSNQESKCAKRILLCLYWAKLCYMPSYCRYRESLYRTEVTVRLPRMSTVVIRCLYSDSDKHSLTLDLVSTYKPPQQQHNSPWQHGSYSVHSLPCPSNHHHHLVCLLQVLYLVSVPFTPFLHSILPLRFVISARTSLHPLLLSALNIIPRKSLYFYLDVTTSIGSSWWTNRLLLLGRTSSRSIFRF